MATKKEQIDSARRAGMLGGPHPYSMDSDVNRAYADSYNYHHPPQQDTYNIPPTILKDKYGNDYTNADLKPGFFLNLLIFLFSIFLGISIAFLFNARATTHHEIDLELLFFGIISMIVAIACLIGSIPKSQKAMETYYKERYTDNAYDPHALTEQEIAAIDEELKNGPQWTEKKLLK